MGPVSCASKSSSALSKWAAISSLTKDRTEVLIDLYLSKTNQKNNKENLLLNYNFLGAARQTRILGRWIKLSKIKKNHNFLKFLNTTWHWLEINLHHPSLFELKKLYDELVPSKFRKYDS